MKRWEIWSEGYSASGDAGTAVHHGSVKAATFKEACEQLADRDREFMRYYDAERLTYWGCRLFDNEGEARATFG